MRTGYVKVQPQHLRLPAGINQINIKRNKQYLYKEKHLQERVYALRGFSLISIQLLRLV